MSMDEAPLAVTRRRRGPSALVTVDASPSLHAARQVYGRDSAQTRRARCDIFSAGSAAATIDDCAPKGSLIDEPCCRNQRQGDKDQLGATKRRRKRPRSTSRNKQDAVDEHQVSPKAAPRLATVRLGHGQNCGSSGVAPRSNGGIGSQTQLLNGNNNGCTSPDATVTAVACSLTPEANDCTTNITSPTTVSKTGRGGKGQTRSRKSKKNTGLKPVRPGRRARMSAGAHHGLSSLSQRELNRQMRLLTPGEQGAINRVLETLAAQIDGKSMRTRDLFNQMDSNRDNVLTRAEMEQALANRGLNITEKQLTHLMAFFDVQGCGYVTLGDLHDSLRTFRAVRQRVHIDGQTTKFTCPPSLPRPKQRPPRDTATVTRVQSTLLAPVVLFTRPVPVEQQGKQQRSNQPRDKRILEHEAGVSYLDITDAEIESLANCLMRERGAEVNDKSGACDEKALAPDDADEASRAAANDCKMRRPLQLVMSTLESAAAQASESIKPNGELTQGVRGPGAAAVPSSAARVLRVLRSLQNMWRRKDRRRRAKALLQRESDHFTEESLSAAVDLFDVDSRGHIDVEDVMAVFRSVRVGRFSRRRPPAAAISSLAAFGRYLDTRGITARNFVEEAATFARMAAGLKSPESCGHPGGTKPQVAATTQVKALLCSEARLSADQCEFVVGCVEEGGFVSAANLDGAVRQARRELAHGELDRRERNRTGGVGGGVEGSETESRVSEMTAGTCNTNSPTRHRQQLGEKAAKKGEIVLPSPCRQRCRQTEAPALGSFNQSDASLVLALFVGEGGGLRNLTGETAAALWRGLKRRGHGMHAYEAGKSASRRVRRLLRLRDIEPLEWFGTLDAATQAPASSDAGVSAVRRVTMSSIVQGVRALVEIESTTCPADIGTAATAATDDDDSVVTSLGGSVSSNHDGRVDRTEGTESKALRWSKPQFAALTRHLDPCGVGSITQIAFQEGLSDCRADRGVYPDAVQLAAARRFEAALLDIGCGDVCALFEMLTNGGRGGGDIVEYVRRMGDCVPNAAQRLEAAARQHRVARVLALRETEVQRISSHKSALLEKVALPENAGALSTIQKLNELMVLQGRRLVAEFHHADTSHSGGVNRAELKQSLEYLVKPCALLRFERKQRRERQEAAAAAAQRAESWKEEFMRKMEALDKSKASHFLEVVSAELRSRRWKISDIFRDVDRAKSGALGVDDLLDNTHRALGLTLEREEAAALISMLDANGDKSIQCEELELALRLYRRYAWERTRWARRKPFHEEFPSLSCLFRRTARASAGIGTQGLDLKQQRPQQRLPALPRSTEVSREDIVEALKRLRGDSDDGATLGSKRGVGQLLPANGANVRRRRVLLKAVRKVAKCCQAAGVRTAPALSATLAFFDFGPVDESRSKAGLMRTVDLWHWLRMLSVPRDQGCDGGGGGDGGSVNSNISVRRQRQATGVVRHRKYNSNRGHGLGAGGGGNTVDGGMVSERLLDSEETSLLLDVVECQPAVEDVGDAAAALAAATEAMEDGFFVSVPALWSLLIEHVPGLWDRDLQAKLEAAEIVRQEKELRSRQQAAALAIQGVARQRQARKIVREARADAVEKSAAAATVQRAVKRRQLHLKQVRLDHIKSNEAAARIQAMERGRVARRDAAAERAARTAAAAKAEAETRAQAELEESARRLAAANEERNAARAAVKIQCAARQRRAREQAALRLRGRREEEEKRALAVMKIQAAERGRVTRRELALRREDARRAAAVKIQSVVRGWLVRKVAEEEAEAAALDAAIAARRARVAAEAEAGATGEGVQGRAGWRKKSVVGARGAEGLAGLQVQVPTSGNPRRDEGMPRSSLYGGVAYS